MVKCEVIEVYLSTKRIISTICISERLDASTLKDDVESVKAP
jgi:hypothetical protein